MRKHPFHKTGAILLSLLVVLASCEEYTEPVNFAPTVTTSGYENPYRFGATLHGSIDNSIGSTLQEYGIQYSAFPSFAEAINMGVAGEGASRNFSVDVAGLTPGTNYYYRTYAFSGYNTVYGEPLSFSTTSTNAPVFGATLVTNVSLTGFDVQTELLDDGGSDLMMQGFILKQVDSEEDTELAVNTPGSSLLVCGNDFHTAVKDLYTGTLYAIRPYGVANGIGYGRIAYVRTQSTDRTVLSSCTLSDSTSNSVRIEAHVLSAGTHPITEVGFCYSTENSQPTVANLTIQSALVDNSFRALLEGLDSDTRYYIRAYAKDETGEYAYGETTEYTVVKHELLEVTTLPADSITHDGAMMHGYVRVNNVEIAEKGFCWSTSNELPTLENANSLVVSNQAGQYSAFMEVESSTTYYYRAYAVNTAGQVFYGEVLSFTSTEVPVYPITLSEVTVTDVTPYSLVAHVEVMGNGGSIQLAKGICYVAGTDIPTIDDNCIDDTDEGDFISITLESLTPETVYTLRAYAMSELGGIWYGDPVTVTTAERTPWEDDSEYPEITQ